jgi:DNA-binding response OmpR family regulator
MRHPDKVLTKERLIEQVYDQHAEHGSNLIEVYVRRLREKIGAERIRTQRGQGYRFVAES